MTPPPPISTLFPYTTLFRSHPPISHLCASAHGLAAGRLLPPAPGRAGGGRDGGRGRKASRVDRKSTRLNSSHVEISYAVFCLKKKKKCGATTRTQTHYYTKC